ncbi:hypothetical protein LV89_01846 [Arcicella aurantiaca]|uniref:Uncharacterized protein n=1 Tax=Arcicella aurantiaca TaxID=591202 RepID=A0A316EBH7_9BACT|nr:hypothetical protein [Arcicella aurantiaca]PWK27034.1 hypothetical protein LV89_01846 [Arcicella aurantiaca]
MTLQERISALATAIGGKIKQLFQNQGNLSALVTTEKTNLVGAINEVANATTLIDDVTPSASKTYSSNKIQSVVSAAATATKNELLGGASSAFDTLQEIESRLGSDNNSIGSLLTAVGFRVRFDAPQTLTAAQITQVNANLGIGEPNTDFVATFNAALV